MTGDTRLRHLCEQRRQVFDPRDNKKRHRVQEQEAPLPHGGSASVSCGSALQAAPAAVTLLHGYGWVQLPEVDNLSTSTNDLWHSLGELFRRPSELLVLAAKTSKQEVPQ